MKAITDQKAKLSNKEKKNIKNMAEYESTLAVLRECYVYRIPPRSTSKGYKAADWDVEKHIWAGRLRITARGEQAFIKLEDPNTGNFLI